MLKFVLHKLISKKWLALCLLIGDILFVAVASSNPLYSDAVLQRSLADTLSQTLTETNAYPAQIVVNRVVQRPGEKEEAFNRMLSQVQAIPTDLEIPVKLEITQRSLYSKKAVLLSVRSNGNAKNIGLTTMTDFTDHISLTAGQMYTDQVEDGVITAVISSGIMRQQDYLVGDEYELQDLLQPNGKPYRLKIVGVYDASEAADVYWDGRTTTLCASPVVSAAVFEEVTANNLKDGYDPTFRYSLFLEYTEIRPAHAEPLIAALEPFPRLSSGEFGGRIIENVTDQLSEFLPAATQFSATLTILYAPVFALLAAFIFMVSRQLMDLEENEIAVIVSRGSRKSQIVLIYFLQAAVITLFGILLGYPLGHLLCRMLGASNAFLEFVQRKALPVAFTVKSMVFACGAACVACAFMTLPVVRYASRSIVQYKVQKQDRNSKPLWQKIYLDLILLAIALYALYSFNQQKAFLAQQVGAGGSLDPLLYFSSSVFILGAGLLGIRLVPWLIRFVNRIFRRLWSPALFVSNLRVIRTRNQQSFIMVFLIMTISLGIFNSTSARTINANAENRIQYMTGADMILQESWVSSITGSGLIEPSFERYTNIEGVAQATKVFYTENAVVNHEEGVLSNVMLMGINTKEFGQVVDFDATLLPSHWYNYLNAISQDPEGILMSANARDQYGMKLGDVINYRDGYGNLLSGTIYGFVEFWPGYSPVRRETTSSGETVETDNILIVASLSYLQLEGGGTRYLVGLRLDGSSQCVYDFAERYYLKFTVFRDRAAELINQKNQPLFQGTNGVLTTNFIVVLLLCAVGFLIYWILSIRSRELQFGIFRAMGMSMREVISMLIWEQILITGSSIGRGGIFGALVTRLYLPLIQMAYSDADQILPMRMITNWTDSVRLFGVIGLVVVVCMVILAWLVSRIRIAQALKLGED